MTYKRFILLSTTILTTLSLAACTTNNSDSPSSSEAPTSESTREDLSQLELPQLDTEIKENESVVELTTTAGVITVKLFPEIAQKLWKILSLMQKMVTTMVRRFIASLKVL